MKIYAVNQQDIVTFSSYYSSFMIHKSPELLNSLFSAISINAIACKKHSTFVELRNLVT
ncbi:hypothetical protein ACN23B_02465 [Anabaena sp. FACHB-709]|uniref:Uncharacterized protein n=2 Tax=Nostocaceae TaxID=1162 RepID=A0A1Z4KR30_ANAVA|nr:MULTISPECIES: hypothetical protein [Nostocaceae]MBD2172143.1 hypothetical protein [Anabaena cylindrica FACHB-318]BAB72452.1 asr0494 [Nostoc sp. PCC 7120 = FACHB-418]BAY71465.1 hypothetical protein NIES23_42830 [Trichormus variabilis NIES-23]